MNNDMLGSKIYPIALFFVGIMYRTFGFQVRKFGRGILTNGGSKELFVLNNSVDKTVSELENTNDLEFYHRLRSCKDGYIAQHINHALDILNDAIRLYGPKQLFSSYNGGKDADVIMHLLRAAMAKYSFDTGKKSNLELIYFVNEDEFVEVEQHINRSEQTFGLNILRYNCSIVQGIKLHVDSMPQDSVPAFVLGTRKGDPNCGLQETFTPSR